MKTYSKFFFHLPLLLVSFSLHNFSQFLTLFFPHFMSFLFLFISRLSLQNERKFDNMVFFIYCVIFPKQFILSLSPISVY